MTNSSPTLRRLFIQHHARHKPAVLLAPYHSRVRAEITSYGFEFWQIRAIYALTAGNALFLLVFGGEEFIEQLSKHRLRLRHLSGADQVKRGPHLFVAPAKVIA